MLIGYSGLLAERSTLIAVSRFVSLARLGLVRYRTSVSIFSISRASTGHNKYIKFGEGCYSCTGGCIHRCTLRCCLCESLFSFLPFLSLQAHITSRAGQQLPKWPTRPT